MFEDTDDILIGISEAATRWTRVSTMCYERHCRCSGATMKIILKVVIVYVNMLSCV